MGQALAEMSFVQNSQICTSSSTIYAILLKTDLKVNSKGSFYPYIRHGELSWLRDVRLDMFVIMVVRISCVTSIRDTSVFNPDLLE